MATIRAAGGRAAFEDLQQELDRAATEGYDVAVAWPAYDLVILKRIVWQGQSRRRHVG